MQIKDKAVGKLADKLEKAERQLADHPLASAPDLRARLAELQKKRSLQEQAKVWQPLECRYGTCLGLLQRAEHSCSGSLCHEALILKPDSETHTSHSLLALWPDYVANCTLLLPLPRLQSSV